MTRSPDAPTWSKAAILGIGEIWWVWLFVPLTIFFEWIITGEGDGPHRGATTGPMHLISYVIIGLMTLYCLMVTINNIRSTYNQETPMERETRLQKEAERKRAEERQTYERLREVYGERDDPEDNHMALTDQGLMALSQYVGVEMAKILRERGLWRPDGPLAVTDRLRDMAALSHGALDARRRFVEQIQKPDEGHHNG